MTVANTNGFSATAAGTVLPPATPARISWNMSPAYNREHDGHSAALRLPHRTWVTPSGSSALEYAVRISPVVVSIRSEWPCSRTGLEQFPTRASASDQASKRPEGNSSPICASTAGVSGGRSSPVSSPWPGNSCGNRAGRVSVTAALVRVLTVVHHPP